MNKFHKVSYEQYANDRNVCDDVAMAEYEAIKLPHRGTAYSAGYDYYAPFDFTLPPGNTIQFFTGIRMEIDKDKWLACYPRSSLGFKYHVELTNTVGVIDADYFEAKNEGHIGVQLYNGGDKFLHIKAGDAFMQGIISPYYLTVDDDAAGIREGGFGSTGR